MSTEIKITNNSYPNEGEVGIEKTIVSYIQHSDTCEDLDTPFQKITFETVPVDFDETENTDSFIRIKIGPGNPDEVDISKFWSVNGLEDLVRIFNDFERRSGTYVRYKLKKIIQKPDGTIIKEEVFE